MKTWIKTIGSCFLTAAACSAGSIAGIAAFTTAKQYFGSSIDAQIKRKELKNKIKSIFKKNVED